MTTIIDMSGISLDPGDRGVVWIPGVGFRPATGEATAGSVLPACVTNCQPLPGFDDLPDGPVVYLDCGGDVWLGEKLGEGYKYEIAARPAAERGSDRLVGLWHPKPGEAGAANLPHQTTELLCCLTEQEPPPVVPPHEPPVAPVPLPGALVMLTVACVTLLITNQPKTVSEQ